MIDNNLHKINLLISGKFKNTYIFKIINNKSKIFTYYSPINFNTLEQKFWRYRHKIISTCRRKNKNFINPTWDELFRGPAKNGAAHFWKYHLREVTSLLTINHKDNENNYHGTTGFILGLSTCNDTKLGVNGNQRITEPTKTKLKDKINITKNYNFFQGII